jgi:uncharacterized membrane protein YbhN (UPF0104 family)
MWNSWISVALKATISAALIGWLLHRTDIAPVAARFGRTDIILVVAAIAVMMGQLLATAWRWQLIGRTMGMPLGGDETVRLTLIGQFFSQTLPSAIGGDAVRAWALARRGVPTGKAAGSVLADRGIALLVLVGLVGATWPLLHARVSDPALRGAVAMLVTGTGCGLALFLVFQARLSAVLGHVHALHPLASIAQDIARILTQVRAIVPIVTVSVVVHLGVIASAWLLARALTIEVSFLDCLVLIPPIVLVTTLPISIGGWGVREGAAVLAFGYVGVPAADALALSVAFGLTQIAVGLPGGALWLGRGRTPSTRGP